MGLLGKMMLKLGFVERWVHIVMLCVLTISYSFLVNDSTHGYLHPLPELRQGDPLSPYLFLLCVEGLFALIEQYEQDGPLKGVTICRSTPIVSHLLFADDSFFFARATMKDCEKIIDILQQYKRASGQKVNLHNSVICFSWNVKRPQQDSLSSLLRVSRVEHHDVYLRLPLIVGRWIGAHFNYIKERLWKRLQSGKDKLLSGARKEILIKVVAQAIRIYTIVFFYQNIFVMI